MLQVSKHKTFNKLQAFWYEKLRLEGFVDIEDVRLANRPLKSWHSTKYGDLPKVNIEATTTYFSLARNLLDTFQFKHEVHRLIWEMYCNGVSGREIANKIKHWKKSKVCAVIAEISKEIKL